MPKVSIITTTYKHERFITSTIESILSQSFTDWELLIGDDNSPDSTYQIIQEYAKKDARIQVWKQPKNIGIVGNMNFLLQKVSPESEYITFLEGDDMYTPDNLDTKVEVFMNHPKVDFFWSDWHQIDAMGVVSSRKTNRKE
jgi:teichuronic acid biosynthesis glycosyltransferase TuaG